MDALNKIKAALGGGAECTGRFGVVDGGNKGIEMTCPDGQTYVAEGDKQEAEQKVREQVLEENDWNARITDET